jgi:hypothetical protein
MSGTANPCTRPECGGEIHTDCWGRPVRCPHETPAQVFLAPPLPPDVTIVSADGIPLVTIHPDGQLDYGPNYTPDEAARVFWDALRRLAPARCPACGHIGLETP